MISFFVMEIIFFFSNVGIASDFLSSFRNRFDHFKVFIYMLLITFDTSSTEVD